MAIAVGIRACEENYRVSFRTAAGLVNEMVEARNESQLSIYIRQFRKIDPNRLNFAPQKTLSFKS